MDGKNLGGKLPWVAKIHGWHISRCQASGWQTSVGGKNPDGKTPRESYFRSQSSRGAKFRGWKLIQPNFYLNTETDRNRNFSTETEITETETKPNLFSINFPLILEIKQTANHSLNISTQNNLLLQIHFQKISFQYFLAKFTSFYSLAFEKGSQ